jgi:CBS domain-containing protein
VRQVVVVDDAGRLAGLLAHEDLVGLQRIGVDEISGRIRAARDAGALRTAAGTIHELADDLLAQGVGAEALGQRIAILNDLLTIRAIELAADAQEPPGVAFCWLAFGSEGRLEQTFATDQDNGLLFDADGADVEETRRALLPFAQAVNETLEACGFPRCKGGIMAGNPRWCLSLDEWCRRFGEWIGRPEPEALLNATIFFDLRPIYGRTALVDQLQAWLFAEIASRPMFLALMAQNALRCEPPLGVLRDFSFDRSREFPGMLDLKAFGSRVFVDAARILSLARGVRHTNTAERLRSVAAEGGLGPGTVAATIDALHFIHLLRLRNQRRPGVPPEGANRVAPRALNDLDRAMLKESFKQARRLQERLRQDYRLEAWG